MAATGNHIVPWEGAFLMRELVGGPVHFIPTSGGHIAGIINPPAKSRREYWTNESETQDAQEWLKDAKEHKGSWWSEWIAWLNERSGEMVNPPMMGNQEFPSIMDAPGSYVLER